MGGFGCTIGQETMEARVRRIVLTVVVWDGEVNRKRACYNGFAVLLLVPYKDPPCVSMEGFVPNLVLILRLRTLNYTITERRDHKL